MRRLIAALFLATASLTHPAAAQERAAVTVPADTGVEIRMRDGSVLYGRVVAQDANIVTLVTAAGARLDLPRGQILSARVTGVAREDGSYWPDDPNATRLMFTSTARPLARGQGYVSSYFLFFPMLAYGVTDRFTLAGGTPVIPGLIGRIVYLAPKLTLIEREKLSFAVGALGFFAPEDVAAGSVGIAYGAATYGSRDRALTFGAGWGYLAASGTSDLSNRPMFVLGGETRTGRGVKLITENWLGFDDGVSGLGSAGIRFIGQRFSSDLGLGGAIGVESGCCFPLVNVVWTFGQQGR